MSTPAAATAPNPVRNPLPGSLDGTTVVVVGGTSGIGLAAGTLLRSVGARPVLVGRDPARLEAAVARVRGDGAADSVLGVAGDGSDERTIDAVLDRAGTVDHIYVTAGGIAGAGPLTGVDGAVARDALTERVWAALATARAAASRLPAGGSLTFSSGILAVRPMPGMAVPLAGVGAVETLVRALAVELAPARQRVNAIRYGRIDTPMLRALPGLDSDEGVAAAGAGVPLGRVGTAEEAAATALFLMANPHVTGQILTVDGGETLTA